MKTILIVEDEALILENNRKAITDAGYNALTASSVAEAKARIADGAPDAIVLDIMLPDGNGLDLLQELRETGNRIPIIMLTAWGKPSDITMGLKLGANDYLSKPFTYDVLTARVEAMFRNVEQMPETVTRGLLTIKLASRAAYVNDMNLQLTAKEFALLQFFIQNENRVMSAGYVYESVWGQPMAGDSQALTSAVSRLRKKLRGCGYTISAEYGTGYCFERGEP